MRLRITLIALLGISISSFGQEVEIVGTNDPNFVNKNGNVGIGSQNPQSKLEVNGNIAIKFGSALRVNNDWNASGNTSILNTGWKSGIGDYLNFYVPGANNSKESRLTILENGNIGIGIDNPQKGLQINQHSADNGLLISEDGNSEKIYLHLAKNSSGEYGYFSLGGDTKLRGNGQMSSFDGSVGIGTIDLQGYKLAVNGSIRSKEVKVEASPWPDYVFTAAYDLPTLEEVQNHINTKGHLPNIPSAKEVAENGIALGEMNAKLLEKIEELTLYTLEQERKLSKQKEKLKMEKLENQRQNEEIQELKRLMKNLIAKK